MWSVFVHNAPDFARHIFGLTTRTLHFPNTTVCPTTGSFHCAKMDDVSQAESPERRRRRPPLACTACRRRKVRCDRKAPCQNCVRARRAAGCAYVVDDRLELREGYQGFSDGINGRSLDKDDVVGATYLTPAATTTSHHSGHENGSGPNSGASALAERVRQLEQQLEQVLASKGSDPAAHKDSQPPPHTRPSPAAQFLGEEHWQIGGGAHKAQYLDGSTADNQSCTRGMLAKSRYLGSSHWIHGLTLVRHPPLIVQPRRASGARRVLAVYIALNLETLTCPLNCSINTANIWPSLFSTCP